MKYCLLLLCVQFCAIALVKGSKPSERMLKISMDDIHLMIDRSNNSCNLAAGKVLEILKDLSGQQRELHDIRVPLLTCVLKSAKKPNICSFKHCLKFTSWRLPMPRQRNIW
ncbi:hypothetical protein CEXT_522381 [Caerostris extrusa]|uniref:Uncharacterized protein n=1 Tax=Caerostris extrusa TaxID=172846 RepID=A0AAV4Q8U8_CAEEX|nr:hypothetical protein CEXT_522381 [Caerostris extrusa]